MLQRGIHTGRLTGSSVLRQQFDGIREPGSQELATTADFAKNAVHLFEAEPRNPTPNYLAALRRAIEAEGIRPLFDEDGEAAGIARQNARILDV
jgi:hypothetical protein